MEALNADLPLLFGESEALFCQSTINDSFLQPYQLPSHQLPLQCLALGQDTTLSASSSPASTSTAAASVCLDLFDVMDQGQDGMLSTELLSAAVVPFDEHNWDLDAHLTDSLSLPEFDELPSRHRSQTFPKDAFTSFAEVPSPFEPSSPTLSEAASSTKASHPSSPVQSSSPARRRARLKSESSLQTRKTKQREEDELYDPRPARNRRRKTSSRKRVPRDGVVGSVISEASTLEASPSANPVKVKRCVAKPSEAELAAYSSYVSATVRLSDFEDVEEGKSKRGVSLKAARERAAATQCGFPLNSRGEVADVNHRRIVMNILER
jgi:hypothetical protein